MPGSHSFLRWESHIPAPMSIWTKRLVPLLCMVWKAILRQDWQIKTQCMPKSEFPTCWLTNLSLFFDKNCKNLCNKQFNCTSKFPSDLYLLGQDHTFTLLHSAKRGWVCCQAWQTQNDLTEGSGSTCSQASSRCKVSHFLWRSYTLLSFMKGSEEVTHSNERLQTFRCVRAGRLTQTASLIGFVQLGSSYGLPHPLPDRVSSEWWLLERAARHLAAGKVLLALALWLCLCHPWAEEVRGCDVILSIIPPLLAEAGP